MATTGQPLVPATPAPLARPSVSRTLLPWLAALAAVAGVGALTLVSTQLAASVALVGLVVASYLGHRPAGLAALWALWLLVPMIRRIFGQLEGYVDADPLAVAPFAATVLVAGLALLGLDLPTRVKVLLGLAAVGLAFGLPRGVSDPTAAAFALLAYGAGLSALVLGYREGAGPIDRLSLSRALLVGAPLVAAYALYQYLVELPPWDALWLETVEFVSAGAPEDGTVRVFSTVNSPGLLATLLAVAVLLGVSRRRLPAWMLPLLGLAACALALTFVRSAWVAFAVGALGFALLAGLRSLPRLAVLVAILVASVAVLSVSGATGTALTERLTTLGALEEDRSASARVDTPLTVLPEVADEPFGLGLGAAGEASRLREQAALRATDNGYLSMVLQLGIVGSAMVIGALLWGVALSLRGLRRGAEDRARAAVLGGLLLFFVVLMATGDQFYGLAGVLLWYLVGVGLRARAEYDHRLA